MQNKKPKTIVICSSASFYKEAVEMKNKLKTLGFKVEVPITTNIMEKKKDFNVSHYKTWFKDVKQYKRKSFLMKHHFNKVKKGDITLILNYEKNGRNGYVGGNVLIEMAIAFDNKKKIYILNPVDEKSNFKEEILGMNPIILNGDLLKIK